MHPESFRSLMCYNPEPLTADQVDDLFQIRWSEQGSNQRRAEESVVAFWRDYLQDVEGVYYIRKKLICSCKEIMDTDIGIGAESMLMYLYS